MVLLFARKYNLIFFLIDQKNDIFRIEKTHQAQMVGLAQAATPGTVVVGWFSTADEPNHFNEIDNLMLEYYSKEAQKPQGADGVYIQPKKLQIIKPIFVRANIQKLRCSVKENTLQEFPISAYLPEAFNATFFIKKINSKFKKIISI